MNFYTSVFKWGNFLYYRGYKDGAQVKDKIKYEPVFFLRDPKNEKEYQSLEGVSLKPHYPGDMKQSQDFIEKYKDVEGFDIYGNDKYEIQYLKKRYGDKVQFDMDKITVYTLDIETAKHPVNGYSEPSEASEPITLITFFDSYSKNSMTFGCKDYKPKSDKNRYIKCRNEEQMLQRCIQFLSRRYPDVITGWNTDGYDIPYLCTRIDIVLGEGSMAALSPWGIVRKRTYTSTYDSEVVTFDIKGIQLIDYLELYKKFTFTPREEYKLDFIAQEELGEKKLDYSGYDDLQDLYEKNFEKYVDYNIHDTVLVDKLEDKLKLIELIITMAYEAKINYKDVFSPVGMWDSIIYNHLLNKKIVIPLQRHNKRKESFEGGYVATPIPGMHDWVVTFDASSLYPSIMVAYNISPETYHGIDDSVSVDKILADMVNYELDVATCANGAMFKRDKQGFIGEIVEYFLAMRRMSKGEMIEREKELVEVEQKLKTDKSNELLKLKSDLEKQISSLNNQQMATKIANNSLYGAMSNVYFRFYNIQLARAITLNGQTIIKQITQDMNKYLNDEIGTVGYDYIFYGDTDSIFVRLGPLVDKEYPNKSKEEVGEILDKLCIEKFNPKLEEICKSFETKTNVFKNVLDFKREIIADKMLISGKKHYVMRYNNSEGVITKEHKLKIKGLELIKSSTPLKVRQMLKDTVEVVMDGNRANTKEYIKKCRKEFFELDPIDIALPRGVNNLGKWSSEGIYSSGTPIHVRGSLLYNFHIKRLKLQNKYEYIKEGDKIKFMYLKMPNTIRENVIAFPSNKIPEEFNLEEYIDYELMFEKVYANALDNIISCLGWKAQEPTGFDI